MVDDVDDALLRALHDHNPWWEDGTAAFSLPARQKSDFYHLVRPDDPDTQFEDQSVLGLVGRRGAGKTTLLHQFVHHQIEAGYAPEQFCYLPFAADPLYQLNSDDQLTRAVRHYETRILGRVDEPDSHFLLLDDVHRIEHQNKPTINGWGTPLKQLLADDDARHVAVTASASLQVERELDRVGLPKEDYDTQPILPEKFRDYLYSIQPELEEPDRRVSPTSIRDGPNSLPAAIDSKSVDALVDELRAKHEQVEDQARLVRSKLVRYLATGGIVAYDRDDDLADETDVTDADFERLRQETRHALYQEVPGFETIKTIDDLERLCALAARNRARDAIRFQGLVELFDVDRRTITDSYLPALDELYLLSGITEYDNRRPRSVRLYLRDTGLVNALTGDDWATMRDDFDREADLARIAAFDHTMRFAYGINAAQGQDVTPSVEYWQTRHGEVDYVFEIDDTPVPIGLAYKPRDREDALTALEAFRAEYDAPVAFLLRGDASRRPEPIEDVQDGIVELPYWLYLLLC
ncbi:ATP-binding protein [Halorubellus sp. JP-L1]|uniref:AAA family ATPase n=1 Tax=Halorubellus sp. JP-L1 TaxID=2715753 RepID=UPI00140CDB64|nr:AAA family ATPase [Halorubellus sp. JP-L1]NHN42957.1 ATP-binding protein [Halorubellus sp. JP-L1]